MRTTTPNFHNTARMGARMGLAGAGLLASALLVGFQTGPVRSVSGGKAPDPRIPVEKTPGVGEPGGPMFALSGAATARFVRGRQLFDTDFQLSDGVGTPEMNADSCRACHQDPAIGGAGGLELNVSRFAYDNAGAGPFQNLPGGQAASKMRPPQVTGREEYDPTADVFEQRQTPPIFGNGLVEMIFDAAILANEDPADTDGDGVFGVARMVNAGSGLEIGRFGWKAQVPMLEDFVRDAMGGECGLTTPDDGRGFALLSDGDGVADPEITETEVGDIAFFMANLAPPARGPGGTMVNQGETHFIAVGCAVCHVPSLASPMGQVELYSDLLLHDVQRLLFRGMSEPGAGIGMFQTPPLWGIRETAPYMHDGRAHSLRAAIGAHFSEGQSAKTAFLALTAAEQDALIAFLEDL